jgi:hypothetical protein
MDTSTILENPLRISSNVLRSCSSSTRGKDCPNLRLNLGMVEGMYTSGLQVSRGDKISGKATQAAVGAEANPEDGQS